MQSINLLMGNESVQDESFSLASFLSVGSFF